MSKSKNAPPNTLIQARRPSMSKMPPPLKASSLSLPRQPSLVFAPLAWLKLRHFLHSDDVEVGGFGISAEQDLLYVERFVTVKQQVGFASVEFDDAAVADHFDDCADRGISPSRCGRIWLHTHPGTSPSPSSTDESTFARVFGGCDWSVMAIVARGGQTYCRLSFSAGPGGQVQIPLVIDWERLPQDLLANEGKLDELVSGWFDEYGRNVLPRPMLLHPPTLPRGRSPLLRTFDDADELFEDRVLDQQDLDERDWERLMDVLQEEQVMP